VVDSWGCVGQVEKWKWLVQPRKAKGRWLEGALCLLSHLPFDLEGLASVTRQIRQLRAQSVEMAHCTPTPEPSTWNGNQHSHKIPTNFTK
jgi:hypothetical protein